MEQQQQQQQENTAEQAKQDFIENVLNKRVEFEKNGVKTRGESLWHVLATFVLEELKHLKELDPIVDAMYSFRVKENASLKGKIERLQKSNKCQTFDSIQRMRWDIAGTRICLYFPCQLPQVKNFIEQNEHFEVIPSTIEDKDNDTELEPIIPPLAKHFRERGYIMRDPETRPYKERMGYYEADHYWIRLKKTHPKVVEQIPNYDGEAIEIQVRTVLMDAWAEVRHDLDYKHILGYPSEDELRVLDAIKGTIASCEIMQDHLFMLREQRIKRGSDLFDFRERKHSWQTIVNSLQPKHRLLLEEFGDTEPIDDKYNTFRTFFEGCNIRMPRQLQNEMADLTSTQKQKRAITLAQDSISLLNKMSSGNLTPSLFHFIATFLLSKMDIEHIQQKLYPYDTIGNPRDPRLLPEDIAYQKQSRNDDVFIDATRWYEILSTVLKALDIVARTPDMRDEHSNDESDDLYTEVVSTTWHVHEWIGTIYQSSDKTPNIASIVTSLCSYYRESNHSIWHQRALWLYAALAFTRFEALGAHESYPKGQSNRRMEAKRSCFYLVKEDWEDDAWRRGEQLAAKMIEVEPRQLKQATLYRALCRSPQEDDYVLHCLEDDDINVNWQDGCGISILGAAAAFGTRETCQALLIRPGVNVNLASSVGLSLIHIAVACENKAMTELLTSNHDLDLKGIWESNYKPATQHSMHRDDYEEGWNWWFGEWDPEAHPNERPATWTEKLSWTALEMAIRHVSTADPLENSKPREIYNLLLEACKSKD